MLALQRVTYTLPNKEILFADLNMVINKREKAGLIGNNGSGKSTLLKVIAGQLQPSSGTVTTGSAPYYLPQVYGQFNNITISQALGVAQKIKSLQAILNGHASPEHLSSLNDDWTIEERCREAFVYWKLKEIDLSQKMGTLSGGQKTKVFLSGIQIHQPQIVLLDEPGNHMDAQGRKILYEYIGSTASTLLVASHDRTLLNLLGTVYELDKRGITAYGGNYDFYFGQKEIERSALDHDMKSKEKALRKAKETERESLERQQKLNARGRKKQEKSGLPKIMMNTLKNNAEKSTARMKDVHTEKVGAISKELSQIRADSRAADRIKMDFGDSILHYGKVLFTAIGINSVFGGKHLWKENLDLQIRTGERIYISGDNGSGKTTLLKMILGKVDPAAGSIERSPGSAIYIDQDYSLINDDITVYEQAQLYNTSLIPEHEVKIRLNRFLFPKSTWHKSCKVLSGGEKMRLMLCSLTLGNRPPDMIALDEPTNNLDIQSIEILTAAVNDYNGTLLVVSHDDYFINQIDIRRRIKLYSSST